MNIRQFALILITSVIFTTNAWAVPAAPIETRVSQPDGTSFIVRARGDEYANWIETLDGHSVIKAGDTWYYAESDNAGGLRASNLKVGSLSPVELQSLPLHLSPTPDPAAYEPVHVRKISRGAGNASAEQAEGLAVPHTQHVLTVLVNYTGLAFTYSDASFQTLIYGAGNSVKDFFLDNSYNGFTVTPAVESYGTANDGIIHVTQPKVHPNHGGSITTSRTEAREIVALTNSFINYASYDANGNGTVTADELSIVIILAGYETSYGAVPLTPNVWGHKSGFTTLTLDGVALSPYTMFGEAHAISAPNKHQATIGIMCHELGHLMLGLPDLYDIDNSNGDSEGIGNWGLMGGGSWNSTASNWSGNSPSHMSAWSKVATRFTTPQEINTNQNGVSFARADANEVARRVWIDKYRLNESFLIENRQLSGYDAGLPGSGLLIWHIDDSLSTNADETHKWVDLEEADGLAHLDNEVNRGDAGDTFPGSSNNTAFNNASNPNSKNYAGVATQIGVTGISASSATMTANIATLAGGLGNHVRYDENGVRAAGGLGSATVWVGLRALNDTANTNFDGVDVYVYDPTGATIDILYYTSLPTVQPANLIHSQTGFDASPGWNRLLLANPQSFPLGAERGVVLKIVNDSGISPIVYDDTGVVSGRSYYDSDGQNTFSSLNGDLNLVALLSGGDNTPPTASSITPSTTGPTNADSVSFNVTFSENVFNFNNSSDVTITHSGTSHSGVTITGSGAAYTVNVTGIGGNGSFTLKASTASDVQDAAGNPLDTSVTSAAVSIDNQAPTISTGAPSASLTNTGPVSFAVNYSGANAVSLANGNITLNKTGTANGSINVTGSGISSRTVTISNITGDGSLGISIVAGTASDTAGNSAPVAGPSSTFMVDNTAPGITQLVPSVTGSTNVSDVSIDIVFSEAVFNFNDANDVIITHSGTSHSGVSIVGAATAFQANITGITGNGSFTLRANTASDVLDAAGNTLAAGITSAGIIIDNIAPEISIGAPSTPSTTNGPVTYTISYSGADEITLNIDDITLNKTGTADGSVDVSGTGTSARTVTVSNIAGSGTLGISIAAASASDDAGNNAGLAGPSATVLVGYVEEIFKDSFETPD